MKYKVILFDADQTLFDFEKTEAEAFKNSIIEYGMEYDESYHFGTYKEINTAIWQELEAGLITVEKLKIERFRRFLKKIGMDMDASEFAGCYMKHLGEGAFLLDGAKDLAKDLSEKYTLSIVTNGITTVQKRRMNLSGMDPYFKDVVISEEVGVSKPNKAIFEHAVSRLGDISKEEVLMVGDNLNSDIKGGINYGIDTCWYNPENKVNETLIIPTYEVNSFAELRKLLL